jgi:dolichol-phosphate mannosyltransferase
MNKNAVLVPTYNEAATISRIVTELSGLKIDILVIDDASPDGTADIVKNLRLSHVHVIDHGKKAGIGPAYVFALQEAIKRGYEKIATMDADGSHLVDDLALMLDQGTEIDVVMGTRWMPDGLVTNWSKSRKLLSKFGTWYARKCLGLPYKDLTGGLRVYGKNALEGIDLHQISSNGYCFQIEMIKSLHAHGAIIKEVPIHFIERQGGVSKMSKSIVFEAFYRVSLWGVQRLFRINADKLHYVK